MTRKKSLFIIILLAFLILVVLFILFFYYHDLWKADRVPREYNGCHQKGGDMMLNSKAELICNIKTKDRGRVCTDSSQCEGYCQASAGAQYNQVVAGYCSEYREKSTDWQEVIGGRAGEDIRIN
jgi:hypothetical protein